MRYAVTSRENCSLSPSNTGHQHKGGAASSYKKRHVVLFTLLKHMERRDEKANLFTLEICIALWIKPMQISVSISL